MGYNVKLLFWRQICCLSDRESNMLTDLPGNWKWVVELPSGAQMLAVHPYPKNSFASDLHDSHRSPILVSKRRISPKGEWFSCLRLWVWPFVYILAYLHHEKQCCISLYPFQFIVRKKIHIWSDRALWPPDLKWWFLSVPYPLNQKTSKVDLITMLNVIKLMWSAVMS